MAIRIARRVSSIDALILHPHLVILHLEIKLFSKGVRKSVIVYSRVLVRPYVYYTPARFRAYTHSQPKMQKEGKNETM
jgi:hypothetical protein